MNHFWWPALWASGRDFTIFSFWPLSRRSFLTPPQPLFRSKAEMPGSNCSTSPLDPCSSDIGLWAIWDTWFACLFKLGAAAVFRYVLASFLVARGMVFTRCPKIVLFDFLCTLPKGVGVKIRSPMCATRVRDYSHMLPFLQTICMHSRLSTSAQVSP